MMWKGIGIIFIWGLCSLLPAAVEGITYQSQAVEGAYENCRKIGGQLVRGTVSVSPVGEQKDPLARLKFAGKAEAEWFPGKTQWDSSTVADGCYQVFLSENNKEYPSELVVLNHPDMVFHGGVLEANEIWSADKVHIIKHWVCIPQERSLTLNPETVVKFCPDTGIKVKGVLRILDAHLISIRDDSLGGDLDMNGNSGEVGEQDWQITNDGGYIHHFEKQTYQAASGFGRMDFRNSFGGHLVRGKVRISPVGESVNEKSSLTIDGQPADGWSIAEPIWNSGQRLDGRYQAVLDEQNRQSEKELAILNHLQVIIHGGTLESDENWTAEKLHIVRNWVRIPSGRTLTIGSGAVVKFCAFTGILVDKGGFLVGKEAVLTSVDNDVYGGDIDMNGSQKVNGLFSVEGTGTIELSDSVMEPMAGNLIWTSGMVHVIDEKFTVPAGLTLEILPGTIVKFASGAELNAEKGGKIIADKVVFTHLADDSAGGDTDGFENRTEYNAYQLTGFIPAGNCDMRYIDWLHAGWNLLALTSGLPDVPLNRELLQSYGAMICSEKTNDMRCYCRASLPLPAGVSLWLFSHHGRRAGFVYDSSPDVSDQKPELLSGWHLTGIPGAVETDISKEHAAWLWKWNQSRFDFVQPKNEDGKYHLLPGRGFFIYGDHRNGR